MTAREIGQVEKASTSLVWKVVKEVLGIESGRGRPERNFTREEARAIMKGLKDRRARNAEALRLSHVKQHEDAEARKAQVKAKKKETVPVTAAKPEPALTPKAAGAKGKAQVQKSSPKKDCVCPEDDEEEA